MMKKYLFFILLAGLLGFRGELPASDSTKVVKTALPAGIGNPNERLAAFSVVSTSEKEFLKALISSLLVTLFYYLQIKQSFRQYNALGGVLG